MSFATNFWIRWRVRIGYPVALIFLVLARPTSLSLIAGGLVGAIGLAVRAWASGYLRKHEILATNGPYAYTRNPLYFGSVILAVGFIIAGHSLAAGIIVAAYLAVFYPAVMMREEAELRTRYGSAFAAYAARVPMFWPFYSSATTKSESRTHFSARLYLRNREYQAALGFVVGLALLWARMYWLAHFMW